MQLRNTSPGRDEHALLEDSVILTRVDKASARLVLPKTAIGKDGFIAILADSEGNHVGLSSET